MLRQAFILLIVFYTPVATADITVGAAASLRESLTEVARVFEKVAETKVQLSFAASSTIGLQVKSGAPFDAIMVADLGTIKRLGQQGQLRPKSTRYIIANRLVMATRTDRTDLRHPKDLLKDSVKRVALCDQVVPIGYYGRKYLAQQRLLNPLQKKIVKPSHVRAALSLIASGVVDAGFVYKTDTEILKSKVKAVWTAPKKFGRAVYPAALTARTKAPQESMLFLDFLKSTTAQKIFRRHGFEAL